jgi:hypothetical protein
MKFEKHFCFERGFKCPCHHSIQALSSQQASADYKMSLLEELPFYNISTKPFTKDSVALKTIIESYGLKSSRIMYRLANAKAFIGGSTATYAYYYNSGSSFCPGDLDIYVHDTPQNRSAIRTATMYLSSCGYVMDIENSFTDFINTTKRTYTPDNNHITEIWSYKHDSLHKNIQIVLVDMEPSQYILNETDISCTSIAIDCATEQIIIDSNDRMSLKYRMCLKYRMFYINSSYHDIYDGMRGDKMREKLLSRIRKYEERGFKFIGKSPDGIDDTDDQYFIRNNKIPKSSKSLMVQDVIAYEDITMYAALRRSDTIVIKVNDNKSYAVNRQAFYDYCNENDKTYWGHRLYRNDKEMSCAPILLFKMYRMYSLISLHDGSYMINPIILEN